MKRAVFLVLIGLAATAASAAMAAPAGSLARSTTKATDQFAACFVHTQDRDSAPWWFVPKENGGGTFSNLGARGVTHPYFVDVTELGSRREIHLELASASPADASLMRAIDSCV
jgi:hypothetical protein